MIGTSVNRECISGGGGTGGRLSGRSDRSVHRYRCIRSEVNTDRHLTRLCAAPGTKPERIRGHRAGEANFAAGLGSALDLPSGP